MLAVGQLDQHDAQIARHRHQHLAEVLGLRLLVGGKFHFVELGEAVDQFGNFAAEFVGQFLLARPGVFQHIMQQGGHDRVAIHPPLDYRAGNGEWVGNVGLTRHAFLMRVLFRRVGVSRLDAFYFFRIQIVETIEENPVGGFLKGWRRRRRR